MIKYYTRSRVQMSVQYPGLLQLHPTAGRMT